ncbi:MAG: hypothetical protein ACYYK0_01880 [Candidatus Eutrophobiaceae bacterium]
MKKIAFILFFCAALIGILLEMDSRGLLRESHKINMDMLHIRFDMRDAETDRPLANVLAKCTRPGNNNACSTRKSHRLGELRISVPLSVEVRQGIFFEIDRQWQLPADATLYVFFIHHDYHTLNQGYEFAELLRSEGKENKVKLTPRP